MAEPIEHAMTSAAQSVEVHSYITTTLACCQYSIKLLNSRDFCVQIKLLNSCDFSTFSAQGDAITAAKQFTVPIVASDTVVDAIAIANVETVAGAVAPDRALHKAWKVFGKGRIELAGINLGGEASENVSAAAGPIAALAIGMLGAEPPQDPGSMQEIMH
jgi:hypothetical protein